MSTLRLARGVCLVFVTKVCLCDVVFASVMSNISAKYQGKPTVVYAGNVHTDQASYSIDLSQITALPVMIPHDPANDQIVFTDHSQPIKPATAFLMAGGHSVAIFGEFQLLSLLAVGVH